MFFPDREIKRKVAGQGILDKVLNGTGYEWVERHNNCPLVSFSAMLRECAGAETCAVSSAIEGEVARLNEVGASEVSR